MSQVLIVEDDQLIAESLGDFLKKKGYEISMALNGVDGLKMVQTKSFDVVIADVMMPEMNGIQFLEQSKYDYPDLEIILMTGYADIKVAIEAMKKGASDFITKPFRLDQVERSVKRLLKKKSEFSDAGSNGNVVRLNRNLEKKIQELSIMYSISEAMDAVEESDQVFSSIVDLAVKITSGSAAFYLNDGNDLRFFLKAQCNSEDFPERSSQAKIAPSVIRKISETREPMVFFEPTGLDIYQPFITDERPIRSLIIAPFYVKTERFGVLVVEEKESELQFTDADVTFIGMLLKKASVALENNALYQTLYNNLVNTLRSLVTTLEAKDEYTQQHSDRVTQLAIRIAGQIGCTEEDIEILRFAGMLHDIGKIGVSDAILQKKGRLTEEEYDVIKEHPTLGAQILEPLNMVPREQTVIKHHHERWDGGGYPDGLKGKDIPFLARIISLADAYDAMTSNRVYRNALPHEKAVAEIERNAWTQFDGIIVKAFLTLCEKSGSDLINK
jgi:putative nucleotidyltransferase with HDIG domain